MATRNILTDGDRSLVKKSRAVKDFNKRLHILLDDMRETLVEANGLGLAAPQVGVLRRAALIVDTGACTESSEEQIIELVNPEIIYCDGEQTGSEGCLSLPGVYGYVSRPEVVKIKAQDRFGEVFELECIELAARAVCHEIDHLDGVIFTEIADRLLTEEEIAEMAERNKQQENGIEEESKSEEKIL